MNKYYKTLELDKIINLLKQNIVLDKSKDLLDETDLYTDIEEIRYVLNEVDEAVIITQRMGRFSIYFKNDADISFYLSKIHKGGTITALELASIGGFLDTIRDLFVYKEKLDSAKISCVYLNNKLTLLTYPKDLNLLIKKIVNPYGEVNDDASANLKSIRKRQKDLEKNLQSKMQEILNKNSDKLSSQLITFRNDRYVIPVKNDYKSQIKGIIHDQSASGETVYIEPIAICELNNSLNQAKEDEKREISVILKNVSFEIDKYYIELLSSYDEIINLDIIYAKARLAINMNASLPKVNNSGYVDLVACHHPLLNVANVVSNNITIGKDYHGIIITGPNTGGKTVLLKTVGLLALMVKMGLLLPCEKNSEIAIFDEVFADIGDEQSIDQNLSTFSSHLKTVIDIINNVTNNSLVLLDELGSGTDPLEGSSLAIAIYNFLLNKQCDIIATSHYSELKIHAYNNSDIINASVEFNIETLKPTYKLLLGVPGMSNALKIASTLGLSSEIIKNAQDYVYEKNDNINEVLEKLIKQSTYLDEKIRNINIEEALLKEKLAQADRELETTINNRNTIINNANKEKDKIIQKAKEEMEEILFELKSYKNKAIKPHELAEIKYRVRNLENSNLEEERVIKNIELTEGMQVYIKGYNTYGKVIKILKNNTYEIQTGIMSIKVDKEDLTPVNNQYKEPQKFSKPQQTVSVKRSVSSKLDLRGERYEDASEKIDKFIDDAIYGGLQIVTIIHGFGTGTIRKLVQEKLKNNKNVIEYRYGGNNEGGQGATIVTLIK